MNELFDGYLERAYREYGMTALLDEWDAWAWYMGCVERVREDWLESLPISECYRE